MLKLSSRIQLSPQLYRLTFCKSTSNRINNTTMATSLIVKSRHLSFNLNIARTFSNRSHSALYSTARSDKLKTVATGPGLKEFLIAGKNIPSTAADNNSVSVPYLESSQLNGNGRKVFFEVYGCQMNSNDGEVVYSVLKSSGYVKVDNIDEADVVLLVTCSIRDRAETKVSWSGTIRATSSYLHRFHIALQIWNRLDHITAMKKKRSPNKGAFQIGILGCMAERLKTKLLEKEQLVDVGELILVLFFVVQRLTLHLPIVQLLAQTATKIFHDCWRWLETVKGPLMFYYLWKKHMQMSCLYDWMKVQ